MSRGQNILVGEDRPSTDKDPSIVVVPFVTVVAIVVPFATVAAVAIVDVAAPFATATVPFATAAVPLAYCIAKGRKGGGKPRK